ncbi:unnamed protein product [Toxocara canis]|uniref:CUB domain-containing protein n=1 Tax=Toxocara canis TaxID=6265 RepID=A0A183UVF0_TOXCA|nr:unnamed protein product [Toxocara canis]
MKTLAVDQRHELKYQCPTLSNILGDQGSIVGTPICPFDGYVGKGELALHTICGHASLCNFETDVIRRVGLYEVPSALADQRTVRCRYNTMMQFVFNYLDAEPPRYCLVHYDREYAGKTALPTNESGNVLSVFEGVTYIVV